MVAVGGRWQYKKFLLFTADAHATLQITVLHDFPFKLKQSLTHSCSLALLDFAPCEKVRMLFSLICFLGCFSQLQDEALQQPDFYPQWGWW